MKFLSYLLLILFFSCNNAHQNELKSISISSEIETKLPEKFQYCWSGKLNSKTNILLHYQLEDKLIAGYLIYLDTKDQQPIRIIGTVEEDQNFRLLEFDKTGNVSGIISGQPNEKEFNGTWFSPKTRKELTMALTKMDSSIKLENLIISTDNINGEYAYQYSQQGQHGYLTIKKVNQSEISINIASVTAHPSRNIATLETDTIIAKTDLVYKIPETDSCEIRIRFFKDFAYINYTKNYCDGIFGHNASVDGIFYKQ